MELELVAVLIENVGTGDVGGQQVRGALQTAKGPAEDARQRLGELRLAGARYILDEQVSFGEQTRQHQLEDIALAKDGALELIENLLRRSLYVAHPYDPRHVVETP